MLFVGRFVPKKGFARSRRPQATSTAWSSSGGDRPAGPDDARLHLPGRQPPDEMAAVYRCVDVMVVASVGECPLTVLEA